MCEYPDFIEDESDIVNLFGRKGGDMWIARRTDYATRAVLALAIAPGDEPVKLQTISQGTGVPSSVLEQVMLQLRNAGIVRSERGPVGGYRLNKDPADITLEDVVRLFQGPLAPISCATRKHPEPCSMTVGCSLREVWEEVRDATITILERTNFADLAKRAGGPWIAHVEPPVRKQRAKT